MMVAICRVVSIGSIVASRGSSRLVVCSSHRTVYVRTYDMHTIIITYTCTYLPVRRSFLVLIVVTLLLVTTYLYYASSYVQ